MSRSVSPLACRDLAVLEAETASPGAFDPDILCAGRPRWRNGSAGGAAKPGTEVPAHWRDVRLAEWPTGRWLMIEADHERASASVSQSIVQSIDTLPQGGSGSDYRGGNRLSL